MHPCNRHGGKDSVYTVVLQGWTSLVLDVAGLCRVEGKSKIQLQVRSAVYYSWSSLVGQFLVYFRSTSFVFVLTVFGQWVS